MQKYAEVYSRLQEDTALVTFKKKDGTVRIMLCTRNVKTAVLVMEDINKAIGLLNGHDRRCGIENGNLAVYDLILGECRSFNIDRVLDIKYFGHLMTIEEINEACEECKKYEESISGIYNADDGLEQLLALEKGRIESNVEPKQNKSCIKVGIISDGSRNMLNMLIKHEQENLNQIAKNNMLNKAKEK